jgi:hypothetical protein
MKCDTFNPMRILEAVKRFLFSLGNRGEVAVTDPPEVAVTPPVNWRDSLPAEIKSHPVFEKYKEPNEAFKALVEAQKFLGVEKMPVPKDANDKETYDLIFNRLGRPKSAEDYVLPTDLQIPKELPVDEAMLTDFKKVAHAHGILPQQFSGLYKWYMTSMAEQFNKYNQRQIEGTKEAETNLRKKWGAAYPQNIALAKKVFQGFADEAAFAEFDKGFGNNPVLIEFFANLGKVLSEDQLSGKPHQFAMTPDEVQGEINKVKGDIKHPYWNSNHPLHAEAVERMSQLTRMLTG